MLTNIKKYWYWYLLGILALIYIIISAVQSEWNPMKWFSSDVSTRTRRCVCGTFSCSCKAGDTYGTYI